MLRRPTRGSERSDCRNPGCSATWRRLGVLSQGRSQKDAAVVGALLLGQRRSHPRGDELTAATGVEQSDRSPMTIAWRAPALLVGRVSRCRRPQTRLARKARKLCGSGTHVGDRAVAVRRPYPRYAWGPQRLAPQRARSVRRFDSQSSADAFDDDAPECKNEVSVMPEFPSCQRSLRSCQMDSLGGFTTDAPEVHCPPLRRPLSRHPVGATFWRKAVRYRFKVVTRAAVRFEAVAGSSGWRKLRLRPGQLGA